MHVFQNFASQSHSVSWEEFHGWPNFSDINVSLTVISTCFQNFSIIQGRCFISFWTLVKDNVSLGPLVLDKHLIDYAKVAVEKFSNTLDFSFMKNLFWTICTLCNLYITLIIYYYLLLLFSNSLNKKKWSFWKKEEHYFIFLF